MYKFRVVVSVFKYWIDPLWHTLKTSRASKNINSVYSGRRSIENYLMNNNFCKVKNVHSKILQTSKQPKNKIREATLLNELMLKVIWCATLSWGFDFDIIIVLFVIFFYCIVMDWTFVRQPVNKTVRKGDLVTLYCRPPHSRPPAKVSWFKNNQLLRARSHISTQPTGDLLFHRYL